MKRNKLLTFVYYFPPNRIFESNVFIRELTASQNCSTKIPKESIHFDLNSTCSQWITKKFINLMAKTNRIASFKTIFGVRRSLFSPSLSPSLFIVVIFNLTLLIFRYAMERWNHFGFNYLFFFFISLSHSAFQSVSFVFSLVESLRFTKSNWFSTESALKIRFQPISTSWLRNLYTHTLTHSLAHTQFKCIMSIKQYLANRHRKKVQNTVFTEHLTWSSTKCKLSTFFSLPFVYISKCNRSF